MSTLSEFQTAFFQSVFQPNENLDNKLSSYVQSTQQINAEQQMGIYSQSIYSGLVNALSDIYPVCEKLIGEEFFYIMAKHYVLSHPSSSPDLADYGGDFPAFINQYRAADSVPYLADVGRLEWAYHRAFHAQNQPAFDFHAFSQYDAEQLMGCVFSLPHESCLIESKYPIAEIWERHQTDEEGFEIEFTKGYFYIYRNEYSIHIDKIDFHEWMFLRAVDQNRPFVEVCEQCTEDMDVSALLVKSLKNSWINYALLEDANKF